MYHASKQDKPMEERDDLVHGIVMLMPRKWMIVMLSNTNDLVHGIN
jgi:hypothetical protein